MEQTNLPENIQENTPIAQQNKKLILLGALAFVLFLIIIGLLLFFMQNRSGNNNPITVLPTTEPTIPATTPTKEPLPPFPSVPYVENQLILQFQDGNAYDELSSTRKGEIDIMLQEFGLITIEKLYESGDSGLENYYLLTFKEGVDLRVAAENIYALPEAEMVEPNAQAQLF